MPKINSYSRETRHNLDSIIELHQTYLNQELLTTSSPQFDELTLNVLNSSDIINSGNITSDSITTDNLIIVDITASGDITGGNLISLNDITATNDITTSAGTVSGLVLSSGSTITAVGTITGAGISSTTTLSATGNISGGSLNISGAITIGSVITTGSVTAGSLSSSSTVSATSSITGGSIISNTTITATGNITGSNITSNNKTTTNTLEVVSTTNSTSAITGSAIFRGGMGVSGDIYTTGGLYNSLVSTGQIQLPSSLNIFGIDIQMDYIGYTNSIIRMNTVDAGSALFNFVDYKAAGSSKYVIKGNGSVGIGTTSPQDKLHVYNGAGTNNILLSSLAGSSTDSTGIFFSNDNVPSQNRFKTKMLAVGDGSFGKSSLFFTLNDQNDSSSATLSDTKMVILYSGNVGIGTTLPTELLHVEGNVLSSGLIAGYTLEILDTTNSTSAITGSAVFGGGIGVSGDIYSTGGIYNSLVSTEQIELESALNSYGMDLLMNYVGYTDTIIKINTVDSGSASFNFVDYKAAGTSKYVVKGDGSVGIGTTSPQDKLHLYNGSGSNNILLSSLAGSSTDSTGIFFANDNLPSENRFKTKMLAVSDGSFGKSSLFFTLNDQNDSSSATLSDTRMVILYSGNVGIGTTVPTELLHVEGNVLSSGLIAGDTLEILDTTNSTSAITGSAVFGGGIGVSGDIYSTGGIYNSLVSTEQIELESALNSYGIDLLMNYVGYTDSIMKINTVDSGSSSFNFVDYKAAGTSKYVVKGDGSVGIGTTSPQDKLHLYNGAGSNNILLTSLAGSSTDSTGIFFSNDNVPSENRFKTKMLAVGDGSFGKSSLFFTLNDQNDSTSATLSDTRMVILYSGNVGIGTTVPTELLQVQGNILSSGIITGDTLEILDTTNSTSAITGSAVFGGGIGVSGDIYSTGGIYNSLVSTEQIELESALNSYGMDLLMNYVGYTDSIMKINTVDSGSASFNFVDYKAAGTSKYTIKGDGSVGIGTTTPQDKLHLYNASGSNNILLSSLAGSATDSTGIFFANDNLPSENRFKTKILAVGDGSFGQSSLFFSLNNQNDSSSATISDTRMVVMNSGNVGIGTTSPTDKLQVYNNTGSSNILISGFASAATDNIGIHFSNDDSPSNNRFKTKIVAVGSGAFGKSELHFLVNGTNDSSSASLSDTRMMISTNGNVGIGTTTPSQLLHVEGNVYVNPSNSINTDNITPTNAGLKVNGVTTGSNGVLQVTSTNSGVNVDGASFRPISDGNNIINFVNTSGTLRGSINGVNSSSVSYNTTSDLRLKKDINAFNSQDILNKILNLVPCNYKWKIDNKDGNGFIAQEVFDIFPEMRPDISSYVDINDENFDINNPINKEGKEHYYSIDYSKFTPYLTSAIHELYKQINELKEKIEILENKKI